MHGKASMNNLKMIIPIVFLASCNSYYFPLLIETPQKIINSFKTYSLSEEYIQNQQYSFLTIALGQQNATFVLSSIENNIYTWVGRDNITFKTFRGIIISSVGLEHNFKLNNPIESIEQILKNNTGNLSFNFDNPRLYELQVSLITSKQSKEKIELSFSSDDINWDPKIFIEYGSKGLPIKTIQSLHPFLKSAKLNFYYKY